MRKIYAITILILLAFFLFNGIKFEFGNNNSELANYYIARGLAQTGALNMVTAIYLDYRLYDTLGEATVFFATALGVFIILRKKEEGGNE